MHDIIAKVIIGLNAEKYLHLTLKLLSSYLLCES
jgi:hypothetical protein